MSFERMRVTVAGVLAFAIATALVTTSASSTAHAATWPPLPPFDTTISWLCKSHLPPKPPPFGQAMTRICAARICSARARARWM